MPTVSQFAIGEDYGKKRTSRAASGRGSAVALGLALVAAEERGEGRGSGGGAGGVGVHLEEASPGVLSDDLRWIGSR